MKHEPVRLYHLICRVWERNPSLDKKTVEKVCLTLIDSIREFAELGGQVSIDKFGVFQYRQGMARHGYSPKKREVIPIPAKLRLKFYPHKVMSLDQIKAPTTATTNVQ